MARAAQTTGLTVAACLALGAHAFASAPEQAKAFAKRAVAHVQEVGRDRAFADFSRPEGGFGWVRFRWPNPASNLIASKVAYVIKVDDQTVCGSGYYEP